MRRCPGCGRELDEAQGGCPACGTLRDAVPCDAHRDRDAVGECVVCGRALCEECDDGPQRAHLCADHRHVRVTEGWAEVLTSTSELEAQLVRDNLRAEGIDAQVYSQRDRIFSVELGELSIVRLLVPVWSYQEASEALAAHARDEPLLACPSCGEAADPEELECSACGRALPRSDG